MQVVVKKLSPIKVDKQTKPEELEAILLKNRKLDKSFLTFEGDDQIDFRKLDIDPNEFNRAIKTIKKLISGQGKIMIYGDYDVDGISSTAILWRAIYPQNKNVLPFIPNRQRDGYGVNYQSFINTCQDKKFWPDLLITVDNGIGQKKEIDQIKKKVSKIVVIDHHQKIANKIKVDGLVHNSQTTASGLAYLVAKEIGHNQDIDLACLGIVADCADMSNKFNRNVVKLGLNKLNKNPNLGIGEMLKSANKIGQIDEWTIGFIIGPRINASGRMDDANDSLRLLCFDNLKKCQTICESLEKLNNLRQTEQLNSYDQIGNKQYKQGPIVELGDFHPGIIGLISGKLVDRWSLPVIIVAKNDGLIYKGSARSPADFDITQFLKQNSQWLETLGGHKGAAGFSIKKENWSRWLKEINKTIIKAKNKRQIYCESEMAIEAINVANFNVIEKFKPWGENNPQPLFLFRDKPSEINLVGKDKNHLRLKFGDIWAIYFGAGDQITRFRPGSLVNFVGQISLNNFNNQQQLQLQIKEMW